MTDTELVVRGTDVDLERATTLADAMVKSNFFPDASTAAKAAVKIIAGAELGIAPAESMRSFHIVEGKIEFAAETLAIRVKQSGRYDYRVLELETDHCLIEFYQDGKAIGRSSFDEDDRDRAGFELETSKGNATPWAKFPRNMMFARAMSNGVAWFCPDVTAGAVATIALPIEAELEPAADGGSEEPAESGAEVGASPASAPDAAALPSPARRATKNQLTKLAVLAQEHGWDDEERHRRAEVTTFRELTKAAAHALIEAWSAKDDEGSEEGSEPEDAAGTDTSASSSEPESDVDADGPPIAELLVIARRHMGTDSAIVVQARKWFPEVTNFESITHAQLGATVQHFLQKDKPEPPT